MDSVAQAKRVPQLDAAGPHFEIGGNRLAPADTARHKHQIIRRQFWQDFLRQHRGRNRADVAARLHPLDHQRIRARPVSLAQQFLAQRQGRRKTNHFRAQFLDRLDAALGRNSARQHDMADLVLGADRDQIEQLRVHGNQVDAEGFAGERLGSGDLAIEQLGGHRPAGDYPEAAGIGDCGDQIALGDPGHCAAEDGVVAAEEGRTARHQSIGLFVHACSIPGIGFRRAIGARFAGCQTSSQQSLNRKRR